MFNMKITNNTDAVGRELIQKLELGLMEVGLTMQSHAQENITMMGAVDTGLLRNSIAFALGGQNPQPSSYSADNGDGSGAYSGAVAKKGDASVTVGTNVEYGKYIELGARNMGARPFLRNAMANYIDEYKEILERHLKE